MAAAGGAARSHKAAWPIYKRLLGYAVPHWPVALLAVIGMVTDAAAATVFTQMLQPLMDDLFINKDPHTIFWMPIWIMIIFAARGAGAFLTRYGTAYVGQSVVQQLRTELFSSYVHMPSLFFAAESSGQQISRVTYTTEQVAHASSNAVKVAIVDGLMVVGMVSVMLYNSVYLTLALLVLVPAIVLVATVVSRRYRHISQSVQDTMGSVTGIVEEAVHGQREVKVYGGQRYENKRFGKIAKHTRHLNMKIATTNALSTSMVQTLAAVALAAIVFLATRPAILNHMTPGEFIVVISAMGFMLPSLKRLTTVQANIQRGMAAADELFGMLDREPEADHGALAPQRCRGALEFAGVQLVYPNADHAALRGVDLECPAGSMTALVGRSGSGKSSLVSLLPRFQELAAGRVLLDGHDLAEYSLAALRRQIAWVGQSVVLFEGSIADNIAYGELAGADREAIKAAATAANAMDFIEALPRGLDAPIGQGGSMLSGGERQRIAMARAILKDAPILILDEATSALDSESERLIQDALAHLTRDRTTLVIAHRLSTVEHADQIAVMDRGRIIEHGRHADLLAADGQYAALHRMQFQPQPGHDAGD